MNPILIIKRPPMRRLLCGVQERHGEAEDPMQVLEGFKAFGFRVWGLGV